MKDFQDILKQAIEKTDDVLNELLLGCSIPGDPVMSNGFEIDKTTIRDRLETKDYVADIIVKKKE